MLRYVFSQGAIALGDSWVVTVVPVEEIYRLELEKTSCSCDGKHMYVNIYVYKNY